MSFCIDQFWPKVGELLYKKGADVGLRPDGLVVKSAAEKIEAERILSENIPSEHSHKRKVFNPSLGELMACMGQIDEFRNVRAQFMTQRLVEGATMKQAEEESREITEENVQRAKELRAERAKRKAKILENIESKLPKSSNPEIRARLIQAYLNAHRAEIIAESERYTLGEIRAEVELNGSVKGEKAKSFLARYAEADDTLEGYEGDLKTAAKEFGKFGVKAMDTLDRFLIPGYSAWADGGDTVEVISSAGSDIALTLVGGKLIKVAWTGTKALYDGAKALGKTLTAGKTVKIERSIVIKQKPNMDPLDFERKVTAQIDLAERGKSVVTRDIIRDRNLTSAKRTRLENMAKTMYKDNPEALARFNARLKTKDVDHMHELQLGGEDHPGNMVMIDSSVNRSVGKQIADQIKDMPEGTVISKIVVERLKK